MRREIGRVREVGAVAALSLALFVIGSGILAQAVLPPPFGSVCLGTTAINTDGALPSKLDFGPFNVVVKSGVTLDGSGNGKTKLITECDFTIQDGATIVADATDGRKIQFIVGGKMVNRGTVSAQGTDGRGGKLVLDVVGDFVNNDGTLNVDGTDAGGKILADIGGQVTFPSGMMSAVGGADDGGDIVFGAAGRFIGNGGTIDVTGALDGGSVSIEAGDRINARGSVLASGTGDDGGSIEIVTPDRINVTDGIFDALGADDDGTISITHCTGNTSGAIFAPDPIVTVSC